MATRTLSWRPGLPLARLSAAAALAAWGSTAWAQTAGTCEISLTYAAAAAPPVGSATAVPGLGMLAVGALAMLVAGLAWRHRHQGGSHRMMAVVGMAAAVSLSALGGGSLVNAVRAAGPYEFSNAAGGTVADNTIVYADPAPVQTVTNTSGTRIRITANGNAADTGSCAVNSEVEPGASCTTQAFACTPPVEPLVITSTAAPSFGCTNDTEPPIGVYGMNSDNPFLNQMLVYAPLVATEPSFDVAGVSTAFSYTREATDAEYDGSNNLTNAEALRTSNASVVATAPAGYVFAPDNTPTLTWNEPIATCWQELTIN
ncbi:midcut-by-XrtH protein [Comamonas sp. JUb58]|uniref:midcut-by-XrtH protein n=1 Tax=Comamonas sp. JUb58 TaxID=2485114 RepID=UPI00105FC06D|nr:midcut-by-XrtH protein [Comamonas sp. JUb58]TDS73887.1 hypothetical protein EDF71_11992 [Comamonas sp. JUb58]